MRKALRQRAESKAWIGGSISSLGSQDVVGLKAVSCLSGDTLARAQATASAKEQVLAALGDAATDLRTDLGESLATVQKFDVPLEQATTGSFEALKAFSLARRTFNYIRGQAQLASQQGPAAAAEFQKILDHRGLAGMCWTSALAHLGLARASRLASGSASGTDAESHKQKSRKAYQDFLTLWKDADPDLSLVRAARAELATLR